MDEVHLTPRKYTVRINISNELMQSIIDSQQRLRAASVGFHPLFSNYSEDDLKKREEERSRRRDS